MAKLIPGGVPHLAELSDEQLLANTRRIAGASNQLLAALLAHLAEVETRGIHRACSCASLYTYCIYELRFSEDAAARRSGAARLVKQFPLLLQAVADGELHLTGLLMIGPHLTLENQVEVLGRAKFRTKKELAKLVRDLNPPPQVPDRMEPLGPQLPRALRNPSWAEFVAAFSPRVRELPPGERPRDWNSDWEPRCVAGDDDQTVSKGSNLDEAALPLGPPPRDLPPVTAPQQYQMQFTTVEAHAKLVERARAILARERPGVTLGELHFEAMQLLVAKLEKRKFAVTPRPPRQRGEGGDGPGAAPCCRGEVGDRPAAPRQRGGDRAPAGSRSRYIPAAVRREVYERDDARCTYVDDRGQRCCETRCLEFHHLLAFAKDGPTVASNLTLRCTAHNALAAEQDFGRECVLRHRDGERHEPRSAQRLTGPG